MLYNINILILNITLLFIGSSCYFRKIPEKVDDQLTLASALIEKRREVAEVDQALAAQKEVIKLSIIRVLFFKSKESLKIY